MEISESSLHRLLEKLQSAAGFEGFRYGFAEVSSGDAQGSFLDNVSHLVTVGGDYHRVQMPDVGFCSLSIA